MSEPCGCKISESSVSRSYSPHFKIKFCPLHSCAPHLLEGLKIVCYVLRSKGGIVTPDIEELINRAEGNPTKVKVTLKDTDTADDMQKKMQDAIDNAEGKP